MVLLKDTEDFALLLMRVYEVATTESNKLTGRLGEVSMAKKPTSARTAWSKADGSLLTESYCTRSEGGGNKRQSDGNARGTFDFSDDASLDFGSAAPRVPTTFFSSIKARLEAERRHHQSVETDAAAASEKAAQDMSADPKSAEVRRGEPKRECKASASTGRPQKRAADCQAPTSRAQKRAMTALTKASNLSRQLAVAVDRPSTSPERAAQSKKTRGSAFGGFVRPSPSRTLGKAAAFKRIAGSRCSVRGNQIGNYREDIQAKKGEGRTPILGTDKVLRRCAASATCTEAGASRASPDSPRGSSSGMEDPSMLCPAKPGIVQGRRVASRPPRPVNTAAFKKISAQHSPAAQEAAHTCTSCGRTFEKR
jgi:hypothetical protein